MGNLSRKKRESQRELLPGGRRAFPDQVETAMELRQGVDLEILTGVERLACPY